MYIMYIPVDAVCLYNDIAFLGKADDMSYVMGSLTS